MSHLHGRPHPLPHPPPTHVFAWLPTSLPPLLHCARARARVHPSTSALCRAPCVPAQDPALSAACNDFGINLYQCPPGNAIAPRASEPATTVASPRATPPASASNSQLLAIRPAAPCRHRNAARRGFASLEAIAPAPRDGRRRVPTWPNPFPCQRASWKQPSATTRHLRPSQRQTGSPPLLATPSQEQPSTWALPRASLHWCPLLLVDLYLDFK